MLRSTVTALAVVLFCEALGMAVAVTLPPLAAYPNCYFWGCLPGNVSSHLPFCDPELSTAQRVHDLVSRLTVDEKLGLLGPDLTGTNVGRCTDKDAGVPRLGIPGCTHLVEDNSGVGSECIAPGVCATNFPGPTGLAASMNRSLWRTKGEVISTEQRALNNVGGTKGFDYPNAPIGLIGFGPNINLGRDPRWGRYSEVPGEDPFLSGCYGVEIVSGMQQGDDPRYIKVVAALKHFTAYSAETNRFFQNFNISAFDLWDSYLPAFDQGFNVGGAIGAMCSYSAVNGVPLCANEYLLDTVVRDYWGHPDAHFQSDCGSITNMLLDDIHYSPTNASAAASAINAGCDMDDGNGFYPPRANGGNGGLEDALTRGLTDISKVDAALTRVLTNERFRTGLVDPLKGQTYTKISADSINSTEHQQINLEAALQSMVLLQNPSSVLPLRRGKTIAVIGPHAVSHRDLLSDYIIDQLCWKGPMRGGTCWPTIGEAFQRLHDANVDVFEGVEINSTNRTMIAPALHAASTADQVVLCLGVGNTEEHEGHDRMDIGLPGLQEEFAQSVLALGKPTVIILVNGGPLAIDTLVGGKHSIVEAFYPSTRGGEALYLQLSGQTNRWGKLPMTIYPKDYVAQVDLHNMMMAKPPGRTYRYYSGTSLWPFGFGLSLTTFNTKCTAFRRGGDLSVNITCEVNNTGERDGDEVVMLFHKALLPPTDTTVVPIQSLVDFQRVSVHVGGSSTVVFSMTEAKLGVTDAQGNWALLAGQHTYTASTGAGWSNTVVTLDIPETRVLEKRPPLPH